MDWFGTPLPEAWKFLWYVQFVVARLVSPRDTLTWTLGRSTPSATTALV